MICISRLRLTRSVASVTAVFLFAIACQVHIAYAAAASTTTTLTATPATAPIITLKATVLTGAAPGTPVTAGTVNFCDAVATHCTGVNVLGTAQLNSLGAATISVPAIASGSYSAAFLGTTADSASTSLAVSLTLSSLSPTTTTISKSGTVGDYSLTATVVGAVSSAGKSAPSGTISFVDADSSMTLTPTATLRPATSSFSQSFVSTLVPAMTTGNASKVLAVGDFNNDGFPDIALISTSTVKPLSILLNNHDGTFTLGNTYATGAGPAAIAVGDFKGNGILDLAVVNTTDGTVSVLFGVGDGTFSAAVPYTTGTAPVAIAVGDLDGDGFLDLAVVNSTAKTVSVLINKHDGTFTTPAPTYATGTVPNSITIGDFNGDGFLDLAVVNATDKTVSVFINKHDGTFTIPAPTYPTGVGPDSIVAEDFNGDGVLDLAVANSTDGTVSVFLGHSTTPGVGDGTFPTHVTYPAGAGPVALVAGDFSGHGFADLATVNQAGQTVSLLVGKGDGTFPATPPPTIPTGMGPDFITAGDFNGDGVTDLAVLNATDATVSVILDQLTQTSTATATGVLVPGFGVQNVEAKYPADSAFAASNSASLALMGSTTSVTVTSSIAPAHADLNSSVTFKATVAPANSTTPPTGAETVAGNVTFSNGGTDLCTNVAIDTTGVAQCTTKSLAAGTDLIVATFTGTGYTSSNSTVSQVVNQTGTSTTVNSSANPSTVNDLVTFMAAVAPLPPAQGVPFTGTVSFTTGSITGVPVTCNGSSQPFDPSTGTATCVTNSLPKGTNKVFAAYAGDSSYTTSNNNVSQIVNAATTSISISSSSPLNTSNVNDPVTFTATLSTTNKTIPFSTTGVVAFTLTSISGAPITCTSKTFDPVAGVATCVTSSLAEGTDVIVATYTGDPNYLTSNNSVSQTVKATTTSVLVTSSSPGNTSNVNNPVTFLATISTTSKTVPFAATGTVSFTLNSTTGTPLTCTPLPVFDPATGTATCVTTSLLAGTDVVFASYTGDPNYRIASGNLSQTVKSAPTSIVVTSSSTANSSNVNDTVTFTAALSTTNKTVPFAATGQVSFTLNSSTGTPLTCASAPMFNSATGTATCVTTSLIAGTDVIVATYTGDPNYLTSNSSVSQAVSATKTSITVTSSSEGNTSNVNDSVTFTAVLSTMSKTLPFADTGKVSFTLNSSTGTPLTCASVPMFDPATGSATCATTSLSVVPDGDVIVATYTGDGNYQTSSGRVIQTVKSTASTIDKIASIFSSDANALAVDQPVAFAATVGPAHQPVPQNGNVTFMIDLSTAYCTNAPDSSKSNVVPITSGTATCALDVTNHALNAGSHTVTAEYNADHLDQNYMASSPVTAPQTVNSAGTTLSVVSSSPTPANAVPTQAITFTATVKPQYPGFIPPKGTVAFDSPDGTANACKAQPVTTAAGLSQAICTVVFPHTTSGMFDVKATYTSLDTNFTGNSGSTTQILENFGLEISVGGGKGIGPVTVTPVTVTQGSSNATDPFNAVTINVASQAIAGFSDSLSLTCSAPAGSGLSCTVPGTLNGSGSSSGSGSLSLPITITASPTATVGPGPYTVTVIATDDSHISLSQQATLINVYVAAKAATLSLVPGAIGTTPVPFPVPAGVTLSSFSCPSAYGNTPTSSPTLQDTSTLLISCKGVPASVAGTYLITISTTVPTTQSSALSPLLPGRLVAAACLGIPFFFLAGLRRNKGLAGRDIFRSLGALLLMVGVAQFTGCGGGGFKPPAQPTAGTGTPPGNYLVNVVAMGSDGNKYQASVPLVVSQ